MYPTLVQDPTSPRLDERVNNAIAYAFENRETISLDELALVVECGQRMLEIYDMLLDDLPPILPNLPESVVAFAVEKTHEHDHGT